MDPMDNFKNQLALLDTMLSKLKSSHGRVRQLKRSVHVLRHLLKDSDSIRSPYGPETPIVRFSIH